MTSFSERNSVTLAYAPTSSKLGKLIDIVLLPYLQYFNKLCNDNMQMNSKFSTFLIKGHL